MKKLNYRELKHQVLSKVRCKHSTAFEFNKIKEISKSYKTKHQDKSCKYEKPKPNKYSEKGFHKNYSE